MPLRFNCEHCDVKIKVPDGSEGKKVKCPSCGQAQRVQLEAPASAGVRPAPLRPVVATSATPPKAMERAGSEPTRPRRQEERPVAAPVPMAEDVGEAEVDDALSALASAATEPQAKSVPPAARLPRAPREQRQGRGRGHGRRGQEATNSNENSNDQGDADTASAQSPVPAAALVSAPVVVAAEQAAPATDDEEVTAASDSGSSIDAPARVPSDRTAQENAALAAFLSEPDPAPPAPVISSSEAKAEMDAEPVVAVAVAAVGPLPEESTFSAALAAVPVEEEPALAGDAISEEDRAAASAAAASRVSQALSTALTTAGAASSAAGRDSSDDTGEAPGTALVTQPAGSSSAENFEGGEAPAGEVRDLFDDFVRREEKERQAELAKEKKRRAAEARRESKADEPAVQPTPVVVVKTVLPPVRRGGVKSQEAGAEAADAPAFAPAAAAAQAASPAPVAVTVAPAAAPRAPQAIPLASAAPLAAPAVAAAAPTMKFAGAAPAPDDEGQSNPLARLSAAVDAKAAPAAPTPNLDAPAPDALLLVLCWMLRMLACLSVVSVTKLLLVWSDAGASAFEVIIVLPLGLGIAAAIWAVGEVARVTRDANRGGPHR